MEGRLRVDFDQAKELLNKEEMLITSLKYHRPGRHSSWDPTRKLVNVNQDCAVGVIL